MFGLRFNSMWANSWTELSIKNVMRTENECLSKYLGFPGQKVFMRFCWAYLKILFFSSIQDLNSWIWTGSGQHHHRSVQRSLWTNLRVIFGINSIGKYILKVVIWKFYFLMSSDCSKELSCVATWLERNCKFANGLTIRTQYMVIRCQVSRLFDWFVQFPPMGG